MICALRLHLRTPGFNQARSLSGSDRRAEQKPLVLVLVVVLEARLSVEALIGEQAEPPSWKIQADGGAGG